MQITIAFGNDCHPRCHCEPVTYVTGVAIRKVSIWNGFPRQCVHWLGMTRGIVLNDKTVFPRRYTLERLKQGLTKVSIGDRLMVACCV